MRRRFGVRGTPEFPAWSGPLSFVIDGLWPNRYNRRRAPQLRVIQFKFCEQPEGVGSRFVIFRAVQHWRHAPQLVMRISTFRFLPLLFILSLAACAREERAIEIDDRFSMNLARIPLWFPGEGEERIALTATEEAVLREKGNPNFIRFWWRHDGSFITSSDLSGKGELLPDMVGAMKKTWIYRYAEVEIEFLPQGGYLEHPMSEKLKLVCDYGDPSMKAPPKMNKHGQLRETWTWIDHGFIIDFLDDVEVSRRHFGGTGEGTFLGH